MKRPQIKHSQLTNHQESNFVPMERDMVYQKKKKNPADTDAQTDVKTEEKVVSSTNHNQAHATVPNMDVMSSLSHHNRA